MNLFRYKLYFYEKEVLSGSAPTNLFASIVSNHLILIKQHFPDTLANYGEYRAEYFFGNKEIIFLKSTNLTQFLLENLPENFDSTLWKIK